MYLYFPGDANLSPFNNPKVPGVEDPTPNGPFGPNDQKHLEAALAGYAWLQSVGMLGPAGLYVDGFHIPGWNNASNPNTNCSDRNDMVYTYNQGVVPYRPETLVGHHRGRQVPSRRLHADTDCHQRDGVRSPSQPACGQTSQTLPPDSCHPWRGLGRAGVLEDQCGRQRHVFAG